MPREGPGLRTGTLRPYTPPMHTVLYVGAPLDDARAQDLLLMREGARRAGDGAFIYQRPGGTLRFYTVSDPGVAMRVLAEQSVDALVIDTREQPLTGDVDSPSQQGPFALTRAGQLLARLFPDDELHAAVQRDRVIGIVGRGGADAAFHFGTYRLRAVLDRPNLDALEAQIALQTERLRAGKVAICLAGGGVEGLFYEIGVLRALESFLVDRAIVDFDLFCGISAGALIGCMLANGVGPDEIGRGLAGGRARVDPIRRSDIFDPNLKELGPRVARAASELVRGGEGPRGALSSVFRAVPGGIFAGDKLRDYLERHLTRPGMRNHFDDLRRPLFVGATDQDTSQAVVFGEEGFRHVPVHKAVRASAALVPFYAPERIDGRYYIDGAFTRTTNMRVAVRQGATMVILIDPLVPVFSDTAGHVHSRGGVYSTMQGLKALINGRFDKAVRSIREMHPEVSFYLFRPYGDEMRILGGSPMKYFYRREVEDVAYRNTVDKIRTSYDDLQRDFGRHGITFRDPEEASTQRGVITSAGVSRAQLGIGL
jgi:NTE family protein